MNLGDGLLFELENGKPKLILLNRGEKVEKNQVKLRPRLPSVLSCRLTSRLDTPRTEEQPIRKQNALNGRSYQGKPGRGGATSRGRGQTVTSSMTQENHAPEGGVKTAAKVKPAKPQTVRPNRKPEESNKKAELKVEPSNQSAALQDSVACLTNEQLRQILNVVQTNNQLPSTEGNQADCGSQSIVSETKGTEERREETENAPDKDKRSGGLFSWMEERPCEDRAKIEAKKAQWKKELDEQVALKQKIHRSAPPRLQTQEDTESLVSVQSSVSYRELPAAIRSSLRLGEVTPMEEGELTMGKREEQRRRWLEELDKQREETSERKRLEKLLHRQTEDQQHWASHFDSLQRAPLAPGPCPSADGTELGPGSSLSLWEEGSCGRDSVRASVETNSSSSGGGQTTRASHLRTMTSLLDPAQIEERERRRLKQLEQQRAIELQMEERRRHREEEEARRKQEEEEEERRVALERERLQRQHERDALRERHKEQSPEAELNRNSNVQPPQSSSESAGNHEQSPEQEAGQTSVSHHRDTAVQTEDVHICESENPKTVGGKENLCETGPDRAQMLQMLQTLQKGFTADVYEPFARTDRSKKDTKRPEWNTQRPSRRFVPASQRYPEELQKQRQESRLRRQAQLLSLQKNPTANQNQAGPETHRGGTSRVETFGQTTERGRSPVHRESPAPDFLPYVRTDEVFNLIPVETEPDPVHALHSAPLPAAPQLLQKTQRQQEIIRGLAQLRQGLLQKQRELESDLSRSRLDHDLRPVSMTTSHRREL